MRDLTPTTPEWLQLLQRERDTGKSVAQIAREVDMPRPSVSLLVNGSYPAGLDQVGVKHGAKILKRYRDPVVCPHLGEAITTEVCADHARRPMPLSHPAKLKHWRACKSCAFNPDRFGEEA